MPPLLEYDNKYWENLLEAKSVKLSLENRLHLVFSLLIFLQISIAQLITFTFTSEIAAVRSKAARFMGFTPRRMMWTCHSSGVYDRRRVLTRRLEIELSESSGGSVCLMPRRR